MSVYMEKIAAFFQIEKDRTNNFLSIWKEAEIYFSDRGIDLASCIQILTH